MIPSAEALEQRMMSYVWSQRYNELAVLEADEKERGEAEWINADAVRERELRDEEEMRKLEEEGIVGAEPGSWERREKRPVMLYAPLVSGLAIILTFLFLGSGMSKLGHPIFSIDLSRVLIYSLTQDN